MAQPAETGHFHAVQFYQDQASLSSIVGGFIAEGFAHGHPAIMIVTPEHRALIEADLIARRINVAELKRTGDLVVMDARDTLAAFMIDGMPNAGMFNRVAGQVLAHLCRTRPNCVVRAYGEMVNVLWKDGLEAAAIRLETLWNELANTHDFKLLCGYSMGNFYKGAAIDHIKGQHSHLIEQEGVTRPLVN